MNKKDQNKPFSPKLEFPTIHGKPAPVLHTIDKAKINFDDPAELMILARIADKSIENPSPEFSDESVQKLDEFLRVAHSLGNDVSELSIFFKNNMPMELPIINTKGALIDVINDTSRAALSDPSLSEIGALAQLFRALAHICFACGFTRPVETVAKELDIASSLWEEGEIQTSDIVRVTTYLKELLQS